ncbi:chemotaxis protein CheW [Pararhodospirillum oryzae]|uniref:Chemotaxis protein CheW n=1 Tax=Pararhodospirillum oryzae TaxID=478448 RepID=A0A512HBL3_9PROT|nr:chemotaxis protein CheW [Pararhodospirillum oryzae]GEO82825.1 chemotaxis protein CheW [Pararhodospirillum oryzae]
MNQLTQARDSRALTPVSGTSALSTVDEQVFVTIYVEKQLFGIQVERVQDILIPEKIARIPLAPPEVAGAINLRGRIVTVIEVRKRLGLRAKKDKTNIMCVTIEQGNELYSMMVDSVGNVLNLPLSRIEPNPTTMDPRWRSVSNGVVRLDGELMVVMDVDAFLSFNAA